MYELPEDEITMLRAIADKIREESGIVSYGFFPGGDPRDFFPDPESCAPEQMEAHKRACELYEQDAIQHVSGQHHFPLHDGEGRLIGYSTSLAFGIGTYTLQDESAARLARDLDEWLDAARTLSDRYK